VSLFLVTGGAGFIGSHLVDRLLANGHEVRVLDDLSTGRRANVQPSAELVVGDVANPAVVTRAMAGAAGCFHLAAIASVQRGNEEWHGTSRINLGGTIAVLDAARGTGPSPIPVVYASSAAVYGDVGAIAATETLRPAPLTAYGADKLASELHAAIGWRVHGVPSLGLRFFNVYGPRQDPSSPYSGVISIFASRIAAGLPVTLHGDGTQTRDFIHVSDVVSHLAAAMGMLATAPGAGVLNVCTGQEVSIRHLALILAGLRGGEAAIVQGPPRAGDIARSVGDASRARQQLGITAQVALQTGLAGLFPCHAEVETSAQSVPG
jgi:UDP-glucose 4-epimerase